MRHYYSQRGKVDNPSPQLTKISPLGQPSTNEISQRCRNRPLKLAWPQCVPRQHPTERRLLYPMTYAVVCTAKSAQPNPCPIRFPPGCQPETDTSPFCLHATTYDIAATPCRMKSTYISEGKKRRPQTRPHVMGTAYQKPYSTPESIP